MITAVSAILTGAGLPAPVWSHQPGVTVFVSATHYDRLAVETALRGNGYRIPTITVSAERVIFEVAQ